jgi:GntR family transcriptional regulator/MocR family aminotransferase
MVLKSATLLSFERTTSVFVKLEGKGHLSQQLYRGLRRAILDGLLPPEGRLPSSRQLARDLGLSRNVVVEAFQQLGSEGYLDARTGSGTYVSKSLPDSLLAPFKAKAPWPVPSKQPALSALARRVLDLSPLPPPGTPAASPLRFDFQYGLPALADFPHGEWSRIVSRRARTITLSTLRYGRILGYGPLRKEVAAFASRSRGVAATPEQVLIMSGVQQALDLVARLAIEPGDRVVIEEPCYQAARQAFQAAGARLVPVPVDDRGLDTTRLPSEEKVKLAYVTPSHQFPLGGILPLQRRLELLRWAERKECFILEDDYDSEYQYEGRPVEAMQGLDRAGRVLYVGTFSKVLFPSLRIGYLIAPESLVPAIAAVKFLADGPSPTFEQAVLADFLSEGHFERHLRRTRERNQARRAALMDALTNELGESIQIEGASAGVHLVVWLPRVSPGRLGAVLSLAAARGLGIYSVEPYYFRPPTRAGLLLGYASLREKDIRQAVTLLAEVLREAATSS